jgi:hypothetical protein
MTKGGKFKLFSRIEPLNWQANERRPYLARNELAIITSQRIDRQNQNKSSHFA